LGIGFWPRPRKATPGRKGAGRSDIGGFAIFLRSV